MKQKPLLAGKLPVSKADIFETIFLVVAMASFIQIAGKASDSIGLVLQVVVAQVGLCIVGVLMLALKPGPARAFLMALITGCLVSYAIAI